MLKDAMGLVRNGRDQKRRGQNGSFERIRNAHNIVDVDAAYAKIVSFVPTSSIICVRERHPSSLLY